MRMPFGKYKGIDVEHLPDDYLDWLMTIVLRGPLASAVHREAARRWDSWTRFDEEPKPPSRRIVPEPEVLQLAERIVTIGFRHLAKELHPDVGGSHGEMILLTAARDFLHSELRGLAQ